APSSLRIWSEAITSLIQGRFSIRHLSAARIVAGRMATAAFLAPPMTTSPERALPPRITNFSKWLLSFESGLLPVQKQPVSLLGTARPHSYFLLYTKLSNLKSAAFIIYREGSKTHRAQENMVAVLH